MNLRQAKKTARCYFRGTMNYRRSTLKATEKRLRESKWATFTQVCVDCGAEQPVVARRGLYSFHGGRSRSVRSLRAVMEREGWRAYILGPDKPGTPFKILCPACGKKREGKHHD